MWVLVVLLLGYGWIRNKEDLQISLTNIREQSAELNGPWGNAVQTFVERAKNATIVKAGRVYAGARWNWGWNFDVLKVKVFMLWTAQGRGLPNIGFLWQKHGLNSELEVLFDESRADHVRLFNVRYVVCFSNSPKAARRIGPESQGHAVHELVEAKGYFALVQVNECFDAWKASKEEFAEWRSVFVLAQNTHGESKHPRVALTEDEACGHAERLDEALPEGTVLSESGNLDRFAARINCKQVRGCSVLLRVTYHPNFEVRRSSNGDCIQGLLFLVSFVFFFFFFLSLAFSVAPSFIGFVVPFGEDSYIVQYQGSRNLFWLSFATLLLCVVGSFFEK